MSQQQQYNKFSHQLDSFSDITLESVNNMSIDELNNKIEEIESIHDKIVTKLLSGKLKDNLELKSKFRKLKSEFLKKKNILEMVLIKKESQREKNLQKERKIFLSNLQQTYRTLDNLPRNEKLIKLKEIIQEINNNSELGWDRDIHTFKRDIEAEIYNIDAQNIRLESQRRIKESFKRINQINKNRNTEKEIIENFNNRTKPITDYINTTRRQIMSVSDYNKIPVLQQDIRTNKTNFQTLIREIKNEPNYKELLTNPPRLTFTWNKVRKTIDNFSENYNSMQQLFNTKKKLVQMKKNR